MSILPYRNTIFVVHMDQGYFTAAEHAAEMAAVRNLLTAQATRHTLRWKIIETSEGVFDWSVYDSLVETNESLSMETFFFIVGSPQWASGSSDQFTVPDAGSGVTASLSFIPKGMLVFSSQVTSLDSIQTNMRFALGATDGSTSTGAWWGSANASSGVSCASRLHSSKALAFADPTSTLLAETAITFNGVNSVADWATVDSTTRYFSYVAVGDVSRVQSGNVVYGPRSRSRFGLAR